MCPLCGGTGVREYGRYTCTVCMAVFVPVTCAGGTVFIQAKDLFRVFPYGGK